MIVSQDLLDIVGHASRQPRLHHFVGADLLVMLGRFGMDELSWQSRALVARNGGDKSCAAARGRGTGTSINSLDLAGMRRRKHEDTIGQIDRLIQVVGNEDNRDVDLAPDFEQMSPACGSAFAEARRARRTARPSAGSAVDWRSGRANDRDPLFHAAGQLMRIRVFGEFFQADQLQPLHGTIFRFVLAMRPFTSGPNITLLFLTVSHGKSV